eukprot:SAG11_NODE_33184_length_278_cov_3.413408_1_plen_60_part_10
MGGQGAMRRGTRFLPKIYQEECYRSHSSPHAKLFIRQHPLGRHTAAPKRAPRSRGPARGG